MLSTAQHLSTLGNSHPYAPRHLCCSSFFSLQFCSHFILLTDKILSFHLFACFGSLAASVHLMPFSNLFSCSFYNEITWHLYPEIAFSSCSRSLKKTFKNAPLACQKIRAHDMAIRAHDLRRYLLGKEKVPPCSSETGKQRC